MTPKSIEWNTHTASADAVFMGLKLSCYKNDRGRFDTRITTANTRTKSVHDLPTLAEAKAQAERLLKAEILRYFHRD